MFIEHVSVEHGYMNQLLRYQ